MFLNCRTVVNEIFIILILIFYIFFNVEFQSIIRFDPLFIVFICFNDITIKFENFITLFIFIENRCDKKQIRV